MPITDCAPTKGAAVPSQRLKQIVDEVIARCERMCAQLDDVKERIKHCHQTSAEACQALERASNTFVASARGMKFDEPYGQTYPMNMRDSSHS